MYAKRDLQGEQQSEGAWGAGTKAGAGTSETNGNVPVSASGSEEGPKTGTDAETSVGITSPLVCERGAFTAWSISFFSALTLVTQE